MWYVKFLYFAASVAAGGSLKVWRFGDWCDTVAEKTYRTTLLDLWLKNRDRTVQYELVAFLARRLYGLGTLCGKLSFKLDYLTVSLEGAADEAFGYTPPGV